MPSAADRKKAEELLASAGLPLLDDRELRNVRAECMRVARKLKLSDGQTIGMVPVDGYAAVPPLAIQLGIALMELGGSTVGYLDANTRWPAFAAPTAATPGGFETRWLFDSFAVLTPNRKKEMLLAVSEQISRARALFQFVVVDLTGFSELGELENILGLTDQTMLVAAAGKTREADLLEMRNRLPNMTGVLLVG